MKQDCPAFDVLSRFTDGALDPREEREVAVHLGGCAACRETLGAIEEVDGLLSVALPAPGAHRFRLARPALLPIAAAVLFAVTLGVVLSMPSRATDSPLAVAEESPAPSDGSAKLPADPAKGVFCQDHFATAELSPLWKTSETISGSNPLVDAQGRRALSLTAHSGGKRRWALASLSNDFPVEEGVSFDVEYRVARPTRGGRMQVLVQSTPAKAGRSVLRWSRTAEEELLEAHADGRGRPVVLWSSKNSETDGGWHRVRLVVRPQEVVLYRDGEEAARKSHGLTLGRAGLTLGTTTDRRGKEIHEPFECQVGDVVVRRELAQ